MTNTGSGSSDFTSHSPEGILTDSVRFPGLLFIIHTAFLYLIYYLIRRLPFNETGLIGNMNYNVPAYAASLVLAFAAFMAVSAVLGSRWASLIPLRLRTGFYLVFFLFSCTYLISCYNREKTLYGGHDLPAMFFREKFPHPVFFVVMMLLTAALFLLLRGVRTTAGIRPPAISAVTRITVITAFSLIAAFLTYSPDTFLNRFWGLYHSHAYGNSIINTARAAAPFSDVNCSIYGHYGLIYYPFVKLLGNNTTAVALTISVFTFVMMAAALYILSTLIEDDAWFSVSALAVLGINVTFFSPGEAFAVMPHRYLFPMITLAFIALSEKRRWNFKRRYLYLPDLLISVLAVTFNLETGVCCAAVLAVYRLALHWRKGKNSGNLLLAAGEVIYLILSFLLPYVLVNLYNLAAGGSWNSIKTFVYPIGSDVYDMQSLLTLPIPTWRSGYFLQIVLFTYIAYSGIRMALRAEEEGPRGKMLILTCISVSGLGSLTYFMNRTAAGNLSIAHIQFVLILACFAQEILKPLDGPSVSQISVQKPENMLYRGMCLLAFCLAAWLAFEAIPGFGTTIQNRIDSVWDTASMRESIETFRQDVPEDILAFGEGMPELYYELGWDPGIIITDWSDMNHYSLEAVKAAVDQCDAFIMTDGTDFTDDRFRLEKQIRTKAFNCGYYVRKGTAD